MAIWSVVVAGIGLFGLCCFGVGGLVLGPVAFFLGNSARRRIIGSSGALGGETLAQVGRIGGIAVALLGLAILIAYAVFWGVAQQHSGR